MKRFYFVLPLILGLLVGFNGVAQRKSKRETPNAQPTERKLVVGIVVDQMRYDYLTRFWDQYGEGGFKRMILNGFNCKDNHFNYVPTYTGPGHASVYTGTTPATHGIIANDWFDKESGQMVYCAGDGAQTPVGTDSDAGRMSPHRLLTTTVTDQLRLHTQQRGKVIAVSLKDRGSILPGGHMANAAYWFHGRNEGRWISSSYYMPDLPQWVKEFNASSKAAAYKKPWTTLKPINTYLESGLDDNNYEGSFDGEDRPVFPHDLPRIWDENGGFDILKATPFGNSLTTDFALAAVEGEGLGSDRIPDFLAISYSSTDYVGHQFGVNSKEIEDTYLRLDADLERLFGTLDQKVGVNAYTVFLTADHAAVNVPAYLNDQNVPSGYVELETMKNKLNEFLKYSFGTTDLVRNWSNNQLFLDHGVIRNLDIDLDDVEEAIAMELLSYDHIARVYTGYQMWQNSYSEGIPYLIQNGYNQKRSGDVIVIFEPATVRYSSTGSTHGSPYSYDTHVPLLFYGNGIRHGEIVRRTQIPDIAPTIAALLGIAFPSGTSGDPIIEVFEP